MTLFFIWREIWQNMHLNCEIKSIMVEYRKCDYYDEIACILLSQEFKHVFHSVPLSSHVLSSAGIYLVE